MESFQPATKSRNYCAQYATRQSSFSKAQPEMDLAMRHHLHRLGQGGIAHYSLGCRKHKASADAYATTKERKQ